LTQTFSHVRNRYTRDSSYNESMLIRKLTIKNYRGVEELCWLPKRGLNVVIGGGDVGKSTVLGAIGLLFSPTSNQLVSDTDYSGRNTTKEFVVEAVISLPPKSEMFKQSKAIWPWEWSGSEAVVPKMSGDEETGEKEPVYVVRVRGTESLDIDWEVEHPNGEVSNFSVNQRRQLGVVSLTNDDRNDRDLRLVFGSALDRLVGEKNLRSKIAQSMGDKKLPVGNEALMKLQALDERLKAEALPGGIELGLTGSHGFSIGALIGLLADKNGVSLPFTSWGSGTKRIASLLIAKSNESELGTTLVDEIERGLEPYRLQQFVSTLKDSGSQSFVTTHSPLAIQYAAGAGLWHLIEGGEIGSLNHPKIAAHQARDPETFLARLSVICEGRTEVGFLTYLLQQIPGLNIQSSGLRLSDGQGNTTVCDLLDASSKSGIRLAGFADNDGFAPKKWKEIKEKLGDLLLQWKVGCTEENILVHLSDEQLVAFVQDPSGELTGMRLRTISDRLGVGKMTYNELVSECESRNISIREIVQSAATGSKEGAPENEEKAWGKHGQVWFKTEEGGAELAKKAFDLSVWPQISGEILPLVNAVLKEIDLDPIIDLVHEG